MYCDFGNSGYKIVLLSVNSLTENIDQESSIQGSGGNYMTSNLKILELEEINPLVIDIHSKMQ